jgi:heme exporter protein A
MTYKNLYIQNLVIKKEDQYLLSQVNFSANNKEIVHLQGRNGVGKTTLLRTICGFNFIEEGSVSYTKELNDKIEKLTYSDFHYIGHNLGIDYSLSVVENIRVWAAYNAIYVSKEKLDKIICEIELTDKKDIKTELLSSGQKKRLSFARLKLINKRVWLLDEIFTGLDKDSVALINNMLVLHAKNNGIVVLTSHQNIDIGYEIKKINIDKNSIQG